MTRNPLTNTTEQLAMRRHLFAPNSNSMRPLADEAMWRILHEIRSAPQLAPFGLYLVGSRLEPGRETADVDLILCPRPGSSFSDVRIERALWHCRAYGLHHATPACLIDPAFRREGPSTTTEPLTPERIFRTTKLFSPRIAALIRARRITSYRRVGRFCIEYWRAAGEASFYLKLPQLPFDRQGRYLRPAIQVTNDSP